MPRWTACLLLSGLCLVICIEAKEWLPSPPVLLPPNLQVNSRLQTTQILETPSFKNSSRARGPAIATLSDYRNHIIAYRDRKERMCYLERMTAGSLHQQLRLLSARHMRGLPPRFERTLYVAPGRLSKSEVWQLAGRRVAEFCRGLTAGLLLPGPPTALVNDLPQDANKAENQWERPQFLKEQITGRSKRQTAPTRSHTSGRRYRGQSQSQFLSYQGGGNGVAGMAEGTSEHGQANTRVTATHGMGQAQSQSSYDDDCEGCTGTRQTRPESQTYLGGFQLPGRAQPGDTQGPAHQQIPSTADTLSPGRQITDTPLPGDRRYPGSKIPGTHLSGDRILGAQVPGTHLPRDTRYPGAQIPGEHLPGDRLPGAQYPGTHMPGDRFPGTQIPGTHLPGDTRYPGAQIPGSHLPGDRLPGAQIPPGTHVPGDTRYPGAHIPGTHLTGDRVPGAQVPGTHLPGDSRFPGAQLPGTHLPGDRLPGVRIPGTHMPGDRFPGAQSSGTHLPGDTRYPEPQIPDLHLPGDRLPGEQILAMHVPGAQIPGRLPGAPIRGTHLPGDLRYPEARIPGAHLTGDRLPGAPISGTHMPGDRFPGAQIPSTHLSGDTRHPGAQIPGSQLPVDRVPGAPIPGTYLPSDRYPGQVPGLFQPDDRGRTPIQPGSQFPITSHPGPGRVAGVQFPGSVQPTDTRHPHYETVKTPGQTPGYQQIPGVPLLGMPSATDGLDPTKHPLSQIPGMHQTGDIHAPGYAGSQIPGGAQIPGKIQPGGGSFQGYPGTQVFGVHGVFSGSIIPKDSKITQPGVSHIPGSVQIPSGQSPETYHRGDIPVTNIPQTGHPSGQTPGIQVPGSAAVYRLAPAGDSHLPSYPGQSIHPSSGVGQPHGGVSHYPSTHPSQLPGPGTHQQLPGTVQPGTYPFSHIPGSQYDRIPGYPHTQIPGSHMPGTTQIGTERNGITQQRGAQISGSTHQNGDRVPGYPGMHMGIDQIPGAEKYPVYPGQFPSIHSPGITPGDRHLPGQGPQIPPGTISLRPGDGTVPSYQLGREVSHTGAGVQTPQILTGGPQYPVGSHDGRTHVGYPGQTPGTHVQHPHPGFRTPGFESYPSLAAPGLQHPTGHPGQYPPGHPGQYPPGHPGQYPPGHPGQYPPGHPGQYSAGHPGQYPTGHPSQYPTGHPGQYPTGPPSSIGAGQYHTPGFTTHSSGPPGHGQVSGQIPGGFPGQIQYPGHALVPGTTGMRPGDISAVRGQTSSTDLSQTEQTGTGRSQVKASVIQENNETLASSSSQGILGEGKAQTQVSGSYKHGGSFSAQAQTSDRSRSAQSQVLGGHGGASSSGQAHGGSGQSQAEVKLSSESGLTSAGSQTSSTYWGTQSEVQAGTMGGSADAQARGQGNTHSQAQVGFRPYQPNSTGDQRTPFKGSGSASAQTGGSSGTSQSQIQGSFMYGVSYTGAAQSSTGSQDQLDRNSMAPLEPLRKIDFSKETSSQTQTSLSRTQDVSNISSPSANPQTTGSVSSQDQFTPRRDPSSFSEHQQSFSSHNSERESSHLSQSGQTKRQNARHSNQQTTLASSHGSGSSQNSSSQTASTHVGKSRAPQLTPVDVLSFKNNLRSTQDGFADTRNGVRHALRKDDDTQQPIDTSDSENPTQNQRVILGDTKGYNVHVVQDAVSAGLSTGDVLQPGHVIPGRPSYVVPSGYRGRVISTSGDMASASTSPGGQTQTQAVILTPGTGNISYTGPQNIEDDDEESDEEDDTDYEDESNYYTSRNGYNTKTFRTEVNQRSSVQEGPRKNARAQVRNAGRTHQSVDDYNIRTPASPESYVSVTKSVTGSNGNEGSKYEHVYYTKSSTCGYFTFSCNIAYGSNGRTKICRPKGLTNSDGTPCCC